MDKKWILVTTTLLMIVVASSIAIPSVAAQSATRALPSDLVEPGETFEVAIAVADYGIFGQVVETLPDGFSYVDSSLSPASVVQDGQEVKFTLLGETSFTYNVTASSVEDTYTFSGILKDADLNEYPVGGDTGVAVAAAVPTATRTLPTDSVEPDETFEVTIAATDYGVMGQVVETLPDGFSYVDSSLPAGSVEQDGQMVEFTLLGETSFTYNVAASSTEGTYTFSGILKDDDKNEYDVGEDSSITVEVPPTRRLTSITVSPPTATLYVGKTQQFTATAYDQDGNPMAGIIIAWTSSDPIVGTIAANGLFTAKAKGDTEITATNGTVTSDPVATVTVKKTGGGGGAPRDSDGDGISDIDEMLAGTDENDPCDPKPECAACLKSKPAATPTPTPTVAPTAAPTAIPTAAPTAEPTAEPTATPEPPGFEAAFAIAGLLAVTYLVLRRRKNT